METDIDTSNYQLVGVRGGNIVVMAPRSEMSKAEALLHAAWLVALADDSDDGSGFRAILEAIQSI